MPRKSKAWGRPSAPSSGAPAFGPSADKPRINVVWFKYTDLRIHDHAPLRAAHAADLPVLHLFVFDPYWYRKKTRICGFPRTGPVRAQFQIEAVADLARNLAAATSETGGETQTESSDSSLVPAGPHLLYHQSNVSSAAAFKEVQESFTIDSVYAFHEICSEELALEKSVRKALSPNTKLRLSWGFELYHRDDLSFDPVNPRGAFNSYTAFRRRVEENSTVRKSKAEDPVFQVVASRVRWKRAYEMRRDCVPGSPELPITVEQLLGSELYQQSLELIQGEDCSNPDDDTDRFVPHHPLSAVKWVGGETAGRRRMTEYIFEQEALYFDYVGATMTTNPAKSCMQERGMLALSPWLAHGCVSPRLLYEAVQKYEKEKRRKSKSTYWIVHELIWRDFVRFASIPAGNKIYLIGGPQEVEVGGKKKKTGKSWGWEWRQPYGAEKHDSIVEKGGKRRWTGGGGARIGSGLSEEKAAQDFRNFCVGRTGFPFLDCFLRELKATGYCNHMGRETNGWFLAGDLGIDWRCGGEWYEFLLIDFEPTANWFNWTYRCLTAAGRGHKQVAANNTRLPPAIKEELRDAALARGDRDAASYPMGRLGTNEVLIWGAQHDPDSTHIKKWIPELRVLTTPIEAREPWRTGGSDRDRQRNPGKYAQVEAPAPDTPTLADLDQNDRRLQAEIRDSGWQPADDQVAQLVALLDPRNNSGGGKDNLIGEITSALYLGWEDTAAAVDIVYGRRERRQQAETAEREGGASGATRGKESESSPKKTKLRCPSGPFGDGYPLSLVRPVSMGTAEKDEAYARKEQRKEQAKVAKERKKLGVLVPTSTSTPSGPRPSETNDGEEPGSGSAKKHRFRPKGREGQAEAAPAPGTTTAPASGSGSTAAAPGSGSSGGGVTDPVAPAAKTIAQAATIAQKAKKGRFKKKSEGEE